MVRRTFLTRFMVVCLAPGPQDVLTAVRSSEPITRKSLCDAGASASRVTRALIETRAEVRSMWTPPFRSRFLQSQTLSSRTAGASTPLAGHSASGCPLERILRSPHPKQNGSRRADQAVRPAGSRSLGRVRPSIQRGTLSLVPDTLDEGMDGAGGDLESQAGQCPRSSRTILRVIFAAASCSRSGCIRAFWFSSASASVRYVAAAALR